MTFISEKLIKCRKGDIHLHYANNKGRGTNNVTLTIVEPETPRLTYTRDYKEFKNQYRTSGWGGKVHIPNIIIEDLGGLIN
jgi:hypothetical protein